MEGCPTGRGGFSQKLSIRGVLGYKCVGVPAPECGTPAKKGRGPTYCDIRPARAGLLRDRKSNISSRDSFDSANPAHNRASAVVVQGRRQVDQGLCTSPVGASLAAHPPIGAVPLVRGPPEPLPQTVDFQGQQQIGLVKQRSWKSWLNGGERTTSLRVFYQILEEKQLFFQRKMSQLGNLLTIKRKGHTSFLVCLI